MKAIARFRYGTPEELKLIETPIPVPLKDEVLVKVKATTVNRTDCAVLTGTPWLFRLFIGVLKPARLITGTDFSGIVVAKGQEAIEFNINDEVYGFYDQGLCSHAEYVAVSLKKAILKKPANITYEQAAASLEGGHYAFYFLNKVNVKKGDHVLVNGATGAIGSAAVQFLKHLGARVTATCDTHYVPTLYSMGADQVIDYLKQDFTTLDQTFDFIFDAVGKSTYYKCRRLLTPQGVYISSELGPYWQNPLLALFSPFSRGRKVKFPIPFSAKKSMVFIQELLKDEKFIPLIDRRYRLEEIANAFTYVMSGQKKGNVIIAIE